MDKLSFLPSWLTELGFWGVFELLWVLVSIGLVITFIWSYSVEFGTATTIDSASLLYLSEASHANAIRHYVFGITVFLTLVRGMRFCYFSSRLTLLLDALASGVSDLMAFLILFFVVFIAFASTAHILFGTAAQGFETFSTTMGTQIGMLFGHVKVVELQRINRYIGPLYYYAFLFIMSLVLMNAFIGIIAYSLFEQRRTLHNHGSLTTDISDSISALSTDIMSFKRGTCSDITLRFLAYLKGLVVYFFTGVHDSDQHDKVLLMNTPLLLEVFYAVEKRTQEQDPLADITIGRNTFFLLVQSSLSRNGKVKLEHAESRKIAMRSWQCIVQWLQDLQENPVGIKELSEYELLEKTYILAENMQNRMVSELSVLRASQRELLRSVHKVEGAVLSVDTSLESQAMARMHERKEVFAELYGALDDSMFASQEKHLDNSLVDRVVHDFHATLEPAAFDDTESGMPMLEPTEIVANGADDDQQLILVVVITSLEIRSLSTAPLYRDRVFAQVVVNQVDQSHKPVRESISCTQTRSADDRSTTNPAELDALESKDNVFTFVEEKHEFQVQSNARTTISFTVFHEVSGIRNVEVCKTPNSVNIDTLCEQRQTQSQTVDMMTPSHSAAVGVMAVRGRVNFTYRVMSEP
eukprot:TRINITY_DN3021_c0_g3_i1.p1 TRINITY_DN3021_c0_g3~~TRINITY_DN3021_c0_g3_i1.p1  ORF type:complete len:639 (-),score=177.31 TRINITY_DN3021_c0_g3_i1:147-2063(-)